MASVSPHTLASTSFGNRSVISAGNAFGTGEPPMTNRRRVDRSASSAPSTVSMSRSIAATPANTVMRSSRMRRNAASARNTGMITQHAPADRNPTSCDTAPVAWNSGAAISVRSPGAAPMQLRTVPALNSRFAWVCIAPFGRPVVPDV